ncbi:MAG: hypothetical protein COA43_05895 [Robiginitomaculum sp.]|nr:MAG: hypothetical protein COA43_05895 [Robiginitomaculum sp.]
MSIKTARTSAFIFVACLFTGNSSYADDVFYELNIESGSFENTLKTLAIETNASLLYPYDQVKTVKVQGLKGNYTLNEALEILLQGTGFIGGLTERGVITISQTINKHPSVLEEKMNIKNTKKKLTVGASAAIIASALASPTQAQIADIDKNTPVATSQPASQIAVMGDLSGRVVLSGSDVGLQGAMVSIDALGIHGFTDLKGNYDLRNIPGGAHVLKVTYLGIPDSLLDVNVTTGQDNDYSFVLSREIDEIVATGTRASQASSLSKQRAAENIATIVSSDVSGRFPDNTVAESLRRVAGISFARTERGGEGKFISIRGLDAGLNNVKINGINSAIASGNNDRRVPFDVFSTDGIGEVVINKTLLPEHEGEGIGGSVELNSRTPFQSRDGRLSISLEGRPNELRGKTGYRAGGSYTKHFGKDKEFGLTLSGSYRKRFIRSYQFDVLGAVIPLQLDPALGVSRSPQRALEDFAALYGDNVTAADILGGDNLTVEDLRSNVFDNDRENIGGNFGLEWAPTDNTNFLLQGSYGKATERNLRSTVSFQQSDRYEDEDDQGNDLAALQYYGRSPEIAFLAEVEDEITENYNLTFIGNTDFSNGTHIRYGGGWTKATQADPNGIEINFRIDDLQDSDPYGLGGPLVPNYLIAGSDTGAGGIDNRYIAFDLDTGAPNNVPQPILTDLGWQALLQTGNIEFEEVDINDNRETDTRKSIFIDITHEINNFGVLKAVKWGAKFETSDRDTRRFSLHNDDGVGSDGTYGGNDSFFLSDTDLVAGTYSHSDIGTPIARLTEQLRFDRDAILAFGSNSINSITPLVNDGTLDFEDLFELSSKEDTYAAYIQGDFETGNWQVIGGARYEHVAIATADQFLQTSAEAQALGVAATIRPSDTTLTYDVILPRIQINYRTENDMVFRGGFYTATARPSASNIGRFSFGIGVDDQGTPVDTSDDTIDVFANLPNDNLKPAYSYNFDLGIEKYSKNVGVISANVFFKHISNFLLAGSQPVNGQANLDSVTGLENLDLSRIDDLSVYQTANGESAEIYGVELNLVRQFDHLPGMWSGLGIFANTTLQKSTASAELRPGFVRTTRFFNAPEYIGTVALTYEKYGLDTTLSYSFQGNKLEDIEGYLNTDEYKQSFSTLDLSAKYRVPYGGKDSRYTVSLRVSDITNGGGRAGAYETIGTGKKYLDDVEYSGREWRLGVSARW